MKRKFIKNILPHLIAIAIFALISIVYCTPILNGEKIDTKENTANAVLNKYGSEKSSEELWNNNVFSGMPSYALSVPNRQNIFSKILTFITFGNFIPIGLIFWYLLGFYILLNIFKVNPWLSIAGSLGFAFSSYLFVIISAGSFAKAIAIGFIAPVVGGACLAFSRKSPWTGMLLTSFFLAMQISTGQLQICCYTGIIILIYLLCELIFSMKEKKKSILLKNFGILMIGVALAFGINSAYILTAKEYMPYSEYAKSELSVRHDESSYPKSFSYGYGIDEMATMLIPNAKGGALNSNLGENSETFKVIEKYYNDETARSAVNSVPTYFGNNHNAWWPNYVGAIIILLFVFGIFAVNNKIKWWLVTITVLSFILTYIDAFEGIKEFLQVYSLSYNGINTFVSPLIIAQFSIPFLAILGFAELLKGNFNKTKLTNALYIALGTIGLIVIIFIIYPKVVGINDNNTNAEESLFVDYYASGVPDDPEYDDLKEELIMDLKNAISFDCVSMVRKDAIRTFVFIILGAVIVYLLIQKRLNSRIAIVACFTIVLADMWGIDKRYFNSDNFVSEEDTYDTYTTVADKSILQDNDISYRVCNISTNTFNDLKTSLYHKSIGGSSEIKLQRYKELFDDLIINEIRHSQYITSTGNRSGFGEDEIQKLYDKQARTPILNMLNSRYFIFNSNRVAVRNNKAFGNAWFVDKISFVDNPDQEIAKLKTAELSSEAIISKQFQQKLNGFNFHKDSLAEINLLELGADYAVYETKTSSEQLAVFSEIYYPKGWTVTIDDEKSDFFRANYILRAMRIPVGKHIIKFSFYPDSYKSGILISYICSIILMILILGNIVFYLSTRKTYSDKLLT